MFPYYVSKFPICFQSKHQSWYCRCQEWLQLLQSGRRKLEETSAVALVDAARMDFLQRKFQTFVKQAGAMLGPAGAGRFAEW